MFKKREKRLATTSTAVEKLKKLEAEAKELRATAKKEAMAAVKAAIADLNSLGFNYQLTEPDHDGPFPMVKAKKAAKKVSGITRQRDPNAACDVCGFATEPGHDGRKHRGQEEKKPFSAKELEAFGLKKK